MEPASSRSSQAHEASDANETVDSGPTQSSDDPSLSLGGLGQEAIRAKIKSLPHMFGRFEIQRELGQGAMGLVFLAFDTRLQRPVALKFPRFNDDADPILRDRFYREARSAATLRHANICPVYDADCVEGLHFIAMAYIQGRPLSVFMDRKSPPNPRTAALVVRKIARAVHEAHKRGVVHRDLNPSNIVIDERNEPIVMDFGLARAFAESDVTRDDKSTSASDAASDAASDGVNAATTIHVKSDPEGDVQRTKRGAIVGTPRYMSPEQARGANDEIGPASDIFSLGVLFYEMLAGRPPFQGESLSELLAQIVSKPAPSIVAQRQDVDPALEAVCLKMLAKRPKDRYATMDDVAAAIMQALGAGTPPERLPSSPSKPKSAAEESAVFPRRRWRLGKLMLAAACLVPIALLLGAIVVKVQTAKGVLVVEIDEDDAEVKVLSEEGVVEIERQGEGGKLRLSIAPGAHQLQVEKDGFRVFAEKFEIAAGDVATIRARLEPLPEVSPLAPATTPVAAKAAGEATPPVEAELADSIQSPSQIAQWLLQTGADVQVVLPDRATRRIAPGEAIPPQLTLTGVFWERKGAMPSFTSIERARFSRCENVVSVSFRDQELQSLEWLAAFPRLDEISIWGGECSNEVAGELGRLKGLRALHITSHPKGLTSSGLSFLRQLPELKVADFNAAPCSDEGLEQLGECRRLTNVNLWAAGVSDTGLAHLRDRRDLARLNVGLNPITVAGLERLGDLPALCELHLWSCKIDDAGLERMTALPWAKNLTELMLGGCQISSQGLRSLSVLKRLKSLSLAQTRVDDEAVATLSQFTELTALDLVGTSVSAESIASLRTALPKCNIAHSAGIRLNWRLQHFAWTAAGPQKPPGDWAAVIASAPLAEVEQKGLKCEWGWAAPHDKVPAEHFAVVARAEWNAEEGGNFLFDIASDDGVRVYLDDELIHDVWKWRQVTRDRVERKVTPGIHNLRVEYFEIDGVAWLDVQILPLPDAG